MNNISLIIANSPTGSKSSSNKHEVPTVSTGLLKSKQINFWVVASETPIISLFNKPTKSLSNKLSRRKSLRTLTHYPCGIS